MAGSPILVMFLAHMLLKQEDQLSLFKIVSGVFLGVGVFLNSNPVDAITEAVRTVKWCCF